MPEVFVTLAKHVRIRERNSKNIQNMNCYKFTRDAVIARYYYILL